MCFLWGLLPDCSRYFLRDNDFNSGHSLKGHMMAADDAAIVAVGEDFGSRML
jgi:hypothetical protein